MDIGKRIKGLRKDADLTLEELAAEMGVSRQTLSRYETGVISNIPSDRIEDLARILHTTPAYLMGWNDDPNDYENMDDFIPNMERVNLMMIDGGMDYEEALAREYAIQNMPKEEPDNPVIKEIEEILNSMDSDELNLAKNVLLALKKQQ